ncbi:MAG: CPBP family intramembrane glutamic endopeptidase [Candidatus Thorarchaeota archaeon]|jgi:membrane protease YdiL (CAAX protease family)
MADTFTIILYSLRITVLLIVAWILHAKVGEYPESLPPSDNPKREIRDSLFLWTTMFVIASVFAFIVYSTNIFDSTDPYSPVLLMTWSAVYTVPALAIPLILVLYVNKWSAGDLGITTKMQQSRVWLYVIIIQIVLIFAELSIRGLPEARPVFFLLISLYGTAFLEEFLYRGVIQTKLERALGQNKGWIYGGIVFGLAHIPANFFGPFWITGSVDIVAGLLMLGVQTVNGWWFGITYTKTRSLIPAIIIHYIADFMLFFLVLFLIF